MYVCVCVVWWRFCVLCGMVVMRCVCICCGGSGMFMYVCIVCCGRGGMYMYVCVCIVCCMVVYVCVGWYGGSGNVFAIPH